MKRTLLVTIFAGAILLSMQVTHAQSPIYREVFGNSYSSNSAPSIVGWAGNWGATASDASVGDNAPGTFNNFGVSTALGKPQNLDNINAGGPALSTANGLMFVSQAGQNFIAYTTGYTVDTTATPINDISFYAGSTFDTAGGIPGFRIAVQIDGNWYASTQVLANSANVSSAGNFSSATVGAQQVTFTWTTAASAWDNLSFTPGTTLALGSTLTSALPGDNVTAFGLYSDATDSLGNTENAIRRFDTYQIDSTVTVPEPSSVMLVLSGVGLLMMSLRRFRKA